jgi:hypothetical protein
VPFEAYNSISKVEQYHVLLRRVCEIIRNKFQNNISAKLALQIVVKIVNDSAGPDGIIPTLLVFGAYPQITDDSSPLPFITKRTETIRKITKEIQRFHTERQVKDVFAIRNSPNTYLILDLLIQSDI